MARFITRKEAEGRKFRLRVFAGMFDFLATIGSLILIFACVALLASLVTWIRNDAKTTFASIEYSITSSIIMPEDEQAPKIDFIIYMVERTIGRCHHPTSIIGLVHLDFL